jgi:hypothetical protein
MARQPALPIVSLFNFFFFLTISLLFNIFIIDLPAIAFQFWIYFLMNTL